MTFLNAGKPQIMIDHNYQEKADFDYTLKTGDDLKFAVCFGSANDLRGSSRKADLRFFTESRSKGRKYFQPMNLTSGDYDLF